jgi:cyclohexyl-isocyanide hydratase
MTFTMDPPTIEVTKTEGGPAPAPGAPARPLSVVILLYPGCTLLDLAGPQAVLASLPGARIQLCWRSTGPVMTDSGALLMADTAFADADPAPDVLLAPGGAAGTLQLLNDHAVLDWLATIGDRAGWVTSVCSGSLLLGAAGLLQGYRATSHWLVRDALALFGATPVAERVVADRNRMSGCGVTAGIDFGLALAARLAGEDAARAIQLSLEYAPSPPFAAGTPEEAGEAITAAVRAAYAMAGVERALRAAAGRMRAVMPPTTTPDHHAVKETDHAPVP